VVVLGEDEADRYGLKEAPARVVVWSEPVPVYGQVVPNPKATVEVRSPFAGTLRAEAGAAWPAPGQRVRSGQVLGWVDVRVGAQERLTLQDNLNDARLKKKGAEEVVRLQRERVNRIEKVSRSQIVPGQQLDDARVLLAEAETELEVAAAGEALWQKALDDVDHPSGGRSSSYSQPLTAPAEGEVTELVARPGMAIEASALVAQLVDFHRPLIRLDVPPDLLASGPPTQVQISAIRTPALSLEATRVGPSPRVEAISQLVGYWYTVELPRSVPDAGWRPGLLVKADVTPPSTPKHEAIAVPAGAVLFHQGRSLVYVRVKPGAYERREVRLLGRESDTWILAPHQDLTGLKSGEVVVRNGAQVLLSEEFRTEAEAD
jgi:cobalt-zinc-cadmium efflux system membrane fusion protein